MRARIRQIPDSVVGSGSATEPRGFGVLKLKKEYRGYVPHFKSYFQINTKTKQLNYFFFGSHSLSKGSFGRACCPQQLKGKHNPTNKRSKKCICQKKCKPVCVGRNFEIGLLILNTSKESRKVLAQIQDLLPFVVP
jgi:hypothetical protein